MGVQVSRQEHLAVVRIEDRDLTDDEQILRMRNDLRAVLASLSSGTRLLLDFRNVDTVASLMLSDLVTLNARATRNGVTLQFWGLSPHVERVIQSCHLDRLFDILDDPPDGVT